MEIHIRIIGVIFILLGGVHVIFPTYFNWKNELKSLSLINRQVMQVHTLFIALTVLLMGFLCVSSAQEMCNSPLGKKLAIGLAFFWSIRLFVQFFGYSPKLWKGKKFETVVHIIFSITWIYVSAVFWMAALV